MSYFKKIIILSQIERGLGGERDATGVVKLERFGGQVVGRVALLNISTEGLYIGLKCKNLPLQSFPFLEGAETTFKLHSASEVEDAVCIVAKDTGATFLPVLSGMGGKAMADNLARSFKRVHGASVKKVVVDRQDAQPAIESQAVTGGQSTATARPPADIQTAVDTIHAKIAEEKFVRQAHPYQEIISPTKPIPQDNTAQNHHKEQSAEFFASGRISEPPKQPADFFASSAEMPSATQSPATVEKSEPQAATLLNPFSVASETAAAKDVATPTQFLDEQIAETNYFDLYRETAASLVREVVPKQRSFDYYKKISAELEELFSLFPEEKTLTKLIDNSYFARINYVGDKYYAVGLITLGDEPQYIVYAVPGEYSSEPPTDLKGSCKWLPERYSDYTGNGYWVMYQDADTGDTVNSY